MKFLSLFLIISLLFPLVSVHAAAAGSPSARTYISGSKGGCYYTKKSKKSNKTYKVYVDKKYCAKKKK